MSGQSERNRAEGLVLPDLYGGIPQGHSLPPLPRPSVPTAAYRGPAAQPAPASEQPQTDQTEGVSSPRPPYSEKPKGLDPVDPAVADPHAIGIKIVEEPFVLPQDPRATVTLNLSRGRNASAGRHADNRQAAPVEWAPTNAQSRGAGRFDEGMSEFGVQSRQRVRPSNGAARSNGQARTAGAASQQGERMSQEHGQQIARREETPPEPPQKTVVKYGKKLIELDPYAAPAAPSPVSLDYWKLKLEKGGSDDLDLTRWEGSAYRTHLHNTQAWEKAQADAVVERRNGPVTPVVVEDLTVKTAQKIKKQLRKKLPGAIERSPAADVVILQAQFQGATRVASEAKPIEAVASERRKYGTVVPSVRELERNRDLKALVDPAVPYGIGEVIADLDPLEAAQRTAAALSVNMPGQKKKPLEVYQFTKDGATYVDALQAAKIVEEESRGGGLVNARSDEIVTIRRAGFDDIETFRSSVGMIGDRVNKDLTMIFSLESDGGYVPMAGGQNVGEEQTDFGLLKLTAIGVVSSLVDRNLQEKLNQPSESEILEIGEGGMQVVTEKRNRTNLVEGVRYLANPEALGLVAKVIKRQQKIGQAVTRVAQIEAAPSDASAESAPDIVDAEFEDSEGDLDTEFLRSYDRQSFSTVL